MISAKEFKDGLVCWYGTIMFSANSFKVIKLDKPVEVEIKISRISGAGDVIWFDLKNKSNSSFIAHKYYRKSYGPSYIFPDLFESKKECVEELNATIRNQMDKLQSFYETKQQYLKNKLL